MTDSSALAKRLAPVYEEAQDLTDRFAATGYRLYLVGGMVRDALLGLSLQEAFDLDFTTDAEPPVVKAILEDCAEALWTQGERFGTIGAYLDGRRVEITTHRSECYVSDSRKPEVEFSDAIQVDLSRRDFTINAMAVELPSGRLVDPFGGADDLAARRLRTPLEPGETFSDDPIRMMRAARFLAQFQLSCEPSLVYAIQQMAERLSIVAHERIRDELDRLLDLANPVPAFQLLFDTDLAHRVLGPISDSVRVLECLGRAESDPMVRLAVLMSGVGVSTEVRQALIERRASKEVAQVVPALLGSAQAALASPPQGLSDLRRWVVDAQGKHAEAIAVAAALGDVGSLAADVAVLLEAEPDLFGPPVLDGGEIMTLLGLLVGPEVGAAVAELRRHRLEAGPLSPVEARAYLLEWHRQSTVYAPPRLV
ncbi:MAG: CCA tRNA nucleotidyltransferase [Acidimicrobiia bacterium]|nr:CCA tRNA nucleotidyltransferase [Acidimicrobiia bacterium]MYC58073.1 CCA tRNA nucleotidyltransferase [Acidimicrobiia bacterium]MYI30754.1 CCA tRNA nucleotidyltransferase [Acidimicrobiia bacterium]